MVIHTLGLQLQGSAWSIPARHRRRGISVLTRLQSASAAALAAFGVVHLSAPLVGLLHLRNGDVNDRVDSVSRWMLLGRVAYQSGVGEAVLWAALATHVVSGVAKRLVSRLNIARSTDKDTAPKESEAADLHPQTSAQPPATTSKLSITQMSGYVLTPLALHHAFVNRILPSSPTPPISGLSPSELDYSFVSHTLSHSNLGVRLIMASAYTLLVGAFAVHTSYAVPALLRSLPKGSETNKDNGRKRSRASISASIAVVLLASLVAIVPVRSSDRLTMSGALKARYDAVLRSAILTRFFFQAS